MTARSLVFSPDPDDDTDGWEPDFGTPTVGVPDLLVFDEFTAARRRRIESTSGQPETVYVVSLANGRTVFVRDRNDLYIVAEVPKDDSVALVTRIVDQVAAELRRIAARPDRVPVDLPFLDGPVFGR